MDHLGACIGLLRIIGDGDGVEFPLTVITTQNAGGIFPCDGGACFHLGPHHLRAIPTTISAFSHEIVDPTLAVFIARIPVLNRGIFDLGVIMRDQFHHCGVQLVGVAHWRGASFKVRHIGVFICDDQCALKLARVFCIDAEIGGQFHRAAHAWGHIDKGAI